MTLNCRGKLIDLSNPVVMGIINSTPDSFYDKSRIQDIKSLEVQVEKMLSEGAEIIDIGAYSSRPSAEDISVEEEANRLFPALEHLVTKFPEAILSVDTFRAQIAEQAIEKGAHIINDISGGQLDADMLEAVANKSIPYIAMHMIGKPQTMQQYTQYDDLVSDVVKEVSELKDKAIKAGIKDVIVDPGFGFSKNLDQNFELLNELDRFKILSSPILVGISRKSMIYKSLHTTPDKALNGTSALHMIALERGANILRVHDVKEAVECVALHKKLKGL